MDRDMRLRKVCPQCNTVVHVKRSCCGCGHVFTLKRKVQVSADKSMGKAVKRRRALRPVHTESTLYLDIPLSRYYLELSRLNCVHTALCARSARCAIAHMPRPFCAIIRIKRETRVGMDRWLHTT